MKRVMTLLTAAAMLAGLLAGCGNGGGETERTPEEWTQLYSAAITDARDEETNTAYSILTSSDDDQFDLILQTLGLTEEDMTAYAISMSLMNVQAYAVAAILPAEGKTETVTNALQTYIDNTKASFEFYLPGPFEVASNARLETLSDGTVLLVMCEDQDTVFDASSSAITAG